jgi:hypothetical protein
MIYFGADSNRFTMGNHEKILKSAFRWGRQPDGDGEASLIIGMLAAQSLE